MNAKNGRMIHDPLLIVLLCKRSSTITQPALGVYAPTAAQGENCDIDIITSSLLNKKPHGT